MAKYKEYDYSQGKFIPIHFDKQILPGTFEHTLHYLIDNEIDLSLFDERYSNDETGAPAYDPAILVKDHTVCLFSRNHLKQKDLTMLQGKHHLHGVIGRHPAALYHHRGFYFIGRSGDHQIIPSSLIGV